MVHSGAQLGPYRLLRRIGSGGMAEVFLAQRIGAQGFARTVAIKTILALGAEEEGISLFLDEARVASYLDHAGIVQTLDLGFESDVLFIVMEYVPGPALSRIIRDLKKQERFLSPQVVAYVGARVAAALDYGHRRATTPDGKLLKLVHRDISPQNIMVTRAGLLKLTDFGVARASVQTHRTRTGQVRGKAAYMAPEQVRAGQLDGRTDVFALALVLFEALTGLRAYQRKTDIMSMRAILTDPLPPIRESNPKVPEELEQVLLRALAKKPDDRFANAQELAEALQRTIKSFSEAAIEAELSRTIEELFGPERFPADGEVVPVEVWHPAPAKDGEKEKAGPQRIPGAKLSPKIQALLQGPGADPLEGVEITTSSSDEMVATPSVLEAPPGEATAADASPAQPWGTYAEMNAEPVAFSELISGPGMPPGQGPGFTPAYAPPPGAQSILTDPARGTPRRGLLLLTGATALVLAVGMVFFLSSRGGEEPAPQSDKIVALPRAGQETVRVEAVRPLAGETRPRQEPPARVAATGAEATREEPPRSGEAGRAEAEPKGRLEPARSAANEAGAGREGAEPERHRSSARRSEARAAEAEARARSEAPAERPANDQQRVMKRVLAAKARAKGDPGLSEGLAKILLNYQLNPDYALSERELDIVKRAEQLAP